MIYNLTELICLHQAMVFIGVREYPLGDNRTIHKILTVFITASIFRVIQGEV